MSDKDERQEDMTALLMDAGLVAAALQVAPQHGRIVSLLITNPVVTGAMLSGIGVNSDPTVAMRRLRIRLKNKVSIRSQYGIGYSLTPDDRMTLLSLIKNFARPIAA